MAETKYGKYFIKEPIERGPMLHICAEEGCHGAQFPGFPVEVQLLCLKEPGTMVEKPHSHDVDELFFIFGGNPRNYFEFGAVIEICVGEEQEPHIVDTTTIVYIPKGVIHCPVRTLKVDNPVQWMHVLFESKYSMSAGHDISQHPSHDIRLPYPKEDILKLRKGITEGIEHLPPKPPH